jgi:pilus assembly protein CpaB
MRAVFGLVMIVGMGLAGFAVYMVNGYVSETQVELDIERQRAAEAAPTVAVYAVTRQMKYGETLTAEDVVLIQYAEQHLPEGVFKTEESLFPDGDKELRVVTRAMEINEPVLAAKVTEPGDIAGITSLLSAGMRAFTISVDVQSGVSGFLRPGDRVDVYWSGNLQTAGGENANITQLILASVELIAIDQTSEANRSDAAIARTVTVQVSPANVAALAQASATGKLSLALVGAGDTETIASIAIDQKTLLGVVEAPELVVQAPIIVEVVEKCFVKQRDANGARVNTDIEIPCV